MTVLEKGENSLHKYIVVCFLNGEIVYSLLHIIYLIRQNNCAKYSKYFI